MEILIDAPRVRSRNSTFETWLQWSTLSRINGQANSSAARGYDRNDLSEGPDNIVTPLQCG
jgi:hypothetical protein